MPYFLYLLRIWYDQNRSTHSGRLGGDTGPTKKFRSSDWTERQANRRHATLRTRKGVAATHARDGPNAATGPHSSRWSFRCGSCWLQSPRLRAPQVEQPQVAYDGRHDLVGNASLDLSTPPARCIAALGSVSSWRCTCTNELPGRRCRPGQRGSSARLLLIGKPATRRGGPSGPRCPFRRSAAGASQFDVAGTSYGWRSQGHPLSRGCPRAWF